MSAIQDLVTETLDMQRGQKKSETGIDHLERNDFIIRKQVADRFAWLASTLAGSMPTNSDVPTMRSTTLPMADMMGEYRSTSKDLRDRLMSQRPSPLLAVASKRRGMLIGTGAINYSPPSATQICFSLSFLIAMCFCSCFPSGCDKV